MTVQIAANPGTAIANVSSRWGETALMPLAVAIAGPAASASGTVALVSSQRREGTTSIVTALAGILELVLSRAVAVVDANLVAPRLHDIYGLPGDPGLAEILRGEVDLDRALKVADDGSLAVLTAGHAAPGEQNTLLASARLGGVLRQIHAEGFEVCLLDCPALLPTPHAALISALADATYLVVRAERTRRDDLRQAAVCLANAGAQLRGSVLNAYREHLPRFVQRLI